MTVAIGDHAHIGPRVALVARQRRRRRAPRRRFLPPRRPSVGAWSVVGAGAAVIGDLPSRTTCVGVPARPLPANRGVTTLVPHTSQSTARARRPHADAAVARSSEAQVAARCASSAPAASVLGRPRRAELDNASTRLVGRRHAVAVANGTLALSWRWRAFRVGPGDEVVVPARSFVANRELRRRGRRHPGLRRHRHHQQRRLTAETLAAVLTDACRRHRVHLGGWAADWTPSMALAEDRDLVVIETAPQAARRALSRPPAGSIGHAGPFLLLPGKDLSNRRKAACFTTDERLPTTRAWESRTTGKSFAQTQRPRVSLGDDGSSGSMTTSARTGAMPEVQSAMARGAAR